jgi:aspartate aminotransferase
VVKIPVGARDAVAQDGGSSSATNGVAEGNGEGWKGVATSSAVIAPDPSGTLRQAQAYDRWASDPLELLPKTPHQAPPGRALGLAASLTRLGTETAFDVLARARALERAGREIIHLEIGEPDFPTPMHVCEAGIEAIRAGHTHYCPTAGLPEFREAAADYLSATRGIAVSAEQVLVANGAKPFLFFTILATCDPGDEVIYPDPGFPIYESAIAWAGATPVPLPLREEREFSFDPAELALLLSERTKLVILNSPENPTGGVLGKQELADAARAIAATEAWVLSDEVYSQLLYDGEFASIASEPGMRERTVILDGLSKTFAMTGWRCGFAALPEPLNEPLVRFFVNSTSSVPPLVQHAGIAALRGPFDEPRRMLEEFRRRRRLIVEGLSTLPGVSCGWPGGAFYAFPNVSELPIAAEELADRLLGEAGVAVLAGSAFGRFGRRNLRLSYANTLENLEQALERIERLLATL